MKKRNALAGIILVLLGLLSAGITHADYYRPEHGYSYRVSYREWDYGFSSYYGYRETCSRSYTGYGVYQTCYDTAYFAPSSYVYIEEYQMSGGYHRVRVFRDDRHHDLYATYYIYESGSTRRVEYREFHSDPIYITPYRSTYYVDNSYVWDSLNWERGFAEVMVGVATVGVGAAVVASSHGNPAVAVAGVASMAVGSLSASIGSSRMEESSLQAHIHRGHYHEVIDVR